MSNDNGSPLGSVNRTDGSAVGQTGSVGRATSVSGGAAKVFREFKWGLLTLFLLMVVVIGLVYDGGRKKKLAEEKPRLAENTSASELSNLDVNGDLTAPPAAPLTAGNLPGTANSGAAALVVPPAPGIVSGPLPGNAGSPGGVAANPGVSSPVIETFSPPPAPGKPASKKETVPGHDKPAAPADKPSGPHMAAPASETAYTVKPGDTLSKIARSASLGKGGIKAILEANKTVLSDPNRLRPGMTLKIPSASASHAVVANNKAEKIEKTAIKNETAAPGNTPAPKTEAAAASDEYVVQSGDTLERIARKLFNDGRKWRDIYEWNREMLSDPSRLRLGQTLKLKQSRAASLPAAASVRAENSALPAAETLQPGSRVAKAAAAMSEGSFQPSEVEVMSSTSPANMP